MDFLTALLGLGSEPKDLKLLQVCVRGVVVFFAALVMVRVAHKRFLARMTAFDTVLGFMLGSSLARAINGSAPFFPTLVVGFVLVFLHRLLSAAAFHSERFGSLIKGHADILVRGGKAEEKKMRTHKISTHDLLEEARLHAQIAELKEIQTATLERNGNISVIPVDDK